MLAIEFQFGKIVFIVVLHKNANSINPVCTTKNTNMFTVPCRV